MKKLNTLIVLAGLTFNSPARPAGGYAGDSINETNNLLFPNKGDGEKCYDASTHILNFGIGFGNPSYQSLYRGAGYSYGITPATSLSYEQPLPKKLGPGYLGVGAYFGYQHEHENYNNVYYYNSVNYYYNHSWNYFMIAARAAYHWDVLNSKNAEVYAGAIIGVRIQTYTYSTNDPGQHDPYTYNEGSVFPAYTVFAGARWYFAKRVGVFGEVGYGISYLTGGISLKF